MGAALAQQVARDVAGRQSAEAAEREHDVGEVLADAAALGERLGRGRPHARDPVRVAHLGVDPVVDPRRQAARSPLSRPIAVGRGSGARRRARSAATVRGTTGRRRSPA